MKKIFFTLSLFLIVCSSFAQQDLINEIKRQAIDSVSKVLIAEREQYNKNLILNQKNLRIMGDSLSSLRLELSKLDKFKTEKKSIEAVLKTKSDSISILKRLIIEKDKVLLNERNNNKTKLKDEYVSGQNAVLQNIINTYNTKTFDELLKTSTIEFVMRDKLLLENNLQTQQLISDLIVCLEAKELFRHKFEATKAKLYQSKLIEIKHKSVVLEKIKSDLEEFQSLNEGLKETVVKLIQFDKDEKKGFSVAGMSLEVQKMKLNKIFDEISLFVFNYDFKVNDYPFLADVIFEIFKIKQPNPDAEISFLLNKL